MDRFKFEEYVLANYPSDRDYPWSKYPNFAVLRHKNRKSFAIVMDIPKARLGLQDDGLILVVNLKCSPILIGSLLSKPGFFPAYHMNKEHWITVALDGSVPAEEIMLLLNISYDATAAKRRKK